MESKKILGKDCIRMDLHHMMNYRDSRTDKSPPTLKRLIVSEDTDYKY